MSTKKKPAKKAAKKAAKKKMEKAEKNCVYVCDVCGCEVVCTTPSEGPLICCNEVMYCC
jgi:hypothetical protein